MRIAPILSIAAVAFAATVPSLARAELLYGVTFDNQLVTFDSASPSTVNTGVFLDGLVGGEAVAGIDFRPSTGQLYVVGTSSRLYTVNLGTGSLTQVGPRFSPVLSGTSFGVGFNPVADRIRVTSDTEQNLRINPNDGSVINDGTITVDGSSSSTPEVTSVAYTNDRAGATSTTLYGFNSEANTLLISTNPNSGTFVTVGSLGLDITGLNGFDISGDTGIAYASVQVAGQTGSRLATINLATGTATMGAEIGSQGSITQLRALAVTPVPEPASFAVLGVGLLALVRRKRK